MNPVKPPAFRYHAPATTAEALAALADAGADGKVLAGGQSLIPLLNMRLASPGHLVDVGGVAELDRVDVHAGGVRVAAGVRQATLERHAAAARACPLLPQALGLVAHPVIRNRGTVCGSIAHADPAGELTAVLALLGGTVHAAAAARGGVGGAGAPADGHARRRDIAAAEFFVAPLTTCLEPGELVEAVTFPALEPGAGSAFVEVARRHGDYALCGVAATVALDGAGRLAGARVGLVSVGPVPQVVDLTEALAGEPATDAAWAAGAGEVRGRVEPEADLHATADYRRHLAGVLTRRALAQAAERAGAERAGAGRSVTNGGTGAEEGGS